MPENLTLQEKIIIHINQATIFVLLLSKHVLSTNIIHLKIY